MTKSGSRKAGDFSLTVEEIISLSKSDLEVMFNLQHLFRVDANSPDKILVYAHLMYQHLERMEKILVGKLRPPGTA